MDFFQTLYGVGKDICRPLAKCLCSVISLPDKFKDLNEQIAPLYLRRDDIKDAINRVNRQKTPTRECKGWIEAVDEIEIQVKEIEKKHLVHKRCLKGCFPDVIARARLYEDVEKMIKSVEDLLAKSKFEGGFLNDLPKVEMLPEKFKELNKQLTTLCRRRDDIKDDIDRLNGQKAPTRECKGWIEDVDKIEKQVKGIEEEVKKIQEHDHLSEGCFPDAICEDVEKTIESVKELQEKSKFEAGFLADLPLAKVEKMPLEDLSVEASTESTLQKILEHVRDGATQKIGIWGMGGIGKTTLMKLFNNRPEITNMFDVVIWVTVSNSWSIRKVQDGVAKRLSLDLKNESDDETVARRLLHALEGKKYLLLLDDVWEFLNLATVGIPSVNQNNSGKVVFTTRELRVCRNMSTNVDIKVLDLPDKEAWEMFNSKVGDVANFQDIKPIAQEILQKCDGLPLALNAVGRALRKVEDVHVWKDFLAKLKSPDKSDIKAMSENVFKVLKASYDRLVSDDAKMKNPFLYCGLFPEDHDIKKSQLIAYWRAEGLLSSNCTMMKAGNEGRTLLHNLTDVSLLEKCKDDDNHVKMHDVIRDLVLYLTSLKGGEESRHVVRAGLSEQETVDIKEWEEATRISFMNAKGYSLPEMPNCPKLLTLLLHCDDSYLQAIPESFFNHMPTLRVLDMSGSNIRSLPSSISNLESLRALLLKRCYKLGALPHEINALKKLEVLKITWHCMRDLPGEIWELTSLKCLKLKGATFNDDEIKVMIPIPSGKISKLSQLEQFEIANNAFELDEESRGVVAGELSNISTPLSSLAFQFGSVNNLKQFVEHSGAWRDGSLTKFHFTVGDKNMSLYFHRKNKRGLGYDGQIDEGSGIVSSAVRDVIKRSEVLELRGIRQVLTKLSDLGGGNISGLKYCSIVDCNALEGLADEDGLQANAFANLEYLELRQLTNLRSILCGRCEISPPMPLKDNFKSLRELNVDECPMLKQLFSSWGLLSQFIHLETLVIRNCKGLEGMISVDNDGIGNNNNSWTPLPKLKSMRLQILEEFVGFFSEGNNNVLLLLLRWPSLETLYFRTCPKLKMLPFGAHDDLQSLKQLTLEELSEFVGFGEGDVSYTSCCWPSLWQLTLKNCPKLETFPLAPHNLPKLQYLGLDNLPDLVSLGEKKKNDTNTSFTTMCWESLKRVHISRCPKLEIFPFGVDSAPNLEKIVSDEDLKWQDHATKLRFSPLKLHPVQVTYDDRYKYHPL